jgi:hypothetical protein
MKTDMRRRRQAPTLQEAIGANPEQSSAKGRGAAFQMLQAGRYSGWWSRPSLVNKRQQDLDSHRIS